MSNLERDPVEHLCTSEPSGSAEIMQPREVPLGGPRAITVRRTLPHRDRRTIGAWCFVDDFGPHLVEDGPGMDVAPHPHTGLQTVSWLLDGQIHHQDSLGSDQLIAPGQLNLMTAGRGISHSEVTPPGTTGPLRGVQLWVALPDADRHTDPAFDHFARLPTVDDGALSVSVLMGSLAGVTSTARTYTPIVGAQIEVHRRGTLELNPAFEHGILALDDSVVVAGHHVKNGELLYLGPGQTTLELCPADFSSDVGMGEVADAVESASDAHGVIDANPRVLLLGGEPLTEDLLMWWNFVGRSHDEMVTDRADWESARGGVDTRFGQVTGYDGPAIPAPALPTTRLLPRPRTRRP